MKKLRWMRLLVPLMILVFMATGCNDPEPKVIAEVNGDQITQEQLDQHYRLVLSYYRQQIGPVDESKDKEVVANLKDSSYEDLVVQRLVWQEAERRNIKVDEKQVEEDMKTIKEQKDAQEENGYKKFLDENGFDEEFIKQEWRTQNLYFELRNDVAKNETVTDQEVETYYNENKEQFKHEAGVQIYHILVETEATAQEVLDKLAAGESFAELASAYSIDPGSKTRGGDVGVVNANTNFVEPFKTEALQLDPGELLTKPVKTEFGYHIIKAGDKLAEGVWPLEKYQEAIRATLLQNKQDQVFNRFLEDLHSKAEIKDYRKKDK